jgi:hypothetical protein
MYRCQPTDRHKVVIPRTLVQKVIKENRNAIFVSHPGVRRTHDLISLNYWWPSMRKPIEDYVKKCELCQRRREMVLPNSNDLKAKISKQDTSHAQRLENLKSSLKLAYKSVAQANKFSLG